MHSLNEWSIFTPHFFPRIFSNVYVYSCKVQLGGKQVLKCGPTLYTATLNTLHDHKKLLN